MHKNVIGLIVISMLLLVIIFALLHFFGAMSTDRMDVSNGYWLNYYRDEDLNCIKNGLDKRSIKHEIRFKNNDKWLVLSDKDDYDAMMEIVINECAP